eukprot:1080111-Prorocentrum_lima.AAC.1
MTSSLVGSEMCIRDSKVMSPIVLNWNLFKLNVTQSVHQGVGMIYKRMLLPVSYTHLTLPTICSV